MTFKFDNVTDLYRSFENADLIGTKKQASLSKVDSATPDMFMSLLNILYPESGGFKNGNEIFEDLTKLAGNDPEKAKTIAKLFRVYTTNVGDKNGNSDSAKIAEWYRKNGRPSAYNY